MTAANASTLPLEQVMDDFVSHAKRTDPYGRLCVALDSLLDRTNPVGVLLSNEDERMLNRFCFVLGMYETVYRSGRVPEELASLGPDPSVEMLLASVNEAWVDDLVALAEGFLASEARELCGRHVAANPTFAGSRDVGGADADIIIGSTLIEVKTTKSVTARKEWIYQLLGYLLLDYDNAFELDGAGFYASRVPDLIVWPVDELLSMLGAGSTTLEELRQDFRGVVGGVRGDEGDPELRGSPEPDGLDNACPGARS